MMDGWWMVRVGYILTWCAETQQKHMWMVPCIGDYYIKRSCDLF